jgi:hypothetical protein
MMGSRLKERVLAKEKPLPIVSLPGRPGTRMESVALLSFLEQRALDASDPVTFC